MNRKKEEKQIKKAYYQTHPCKETFQCSVCGRTVVPEGAGSEHRNHALKPLCEPPFPIERMRELTKQMDEDESEEV